MPPRGPTVDWDKYWPDVERMTKKGEGPNKISKYFEDELNVIITPRIIQKERDRRGLKTPTLNTYRKEILQWRREGVTREEISTRIFERCGYRFHPVGVSDAIIRWSKKEGKERPAKSTRTGVKQNLGPWKDSFMQWQEEGMSVEMMIIKFKESFDITTSPFFVRKYLELWNSIWIGIEMDQGWQHVPMDQRTDNEIQNLESAMKVSYRRDACPPEDVMEQVWFDILVDAACYDRGAQSLIVKELYQPGMHWSSLRLFNVLWAMGVCLPGSYCFGKTDSRTKIMEIIDAMTPKILEKVRQRLSAWLLEGVKATCEADGDGWFQDAMSETLATNPAMCVGRLLQIAQSERETEEQRTALRAGSTQVLGHATKKIYRFYGQERQEPNTSEAFAHIILKELKQKWRPETALRELPPLTDTEREMIQIKSIELQLNELPERNLRTDDAAFDNLKSQLAAMAKIPEFNTLHPFTESELKMMDEEPNDGDYLEDDRDGGIEYQVSESTYDLLKQIRKDEQKQFVDADDEESSERASGQASEPARALLDQMKDDEQNQAMAADEGEQSSGSESDDTDEEDNIQRGRFLCLKDEIQRRINRHGQPGYTHTPAGNNLYRILASRVRFSIRKQPVVFHHWMTPTTGALRGAAPARFEFEPWEPDPKAVVEKIIRFGVVGSSTEQQRARSICDAQKLSQAEAGQVIGSKEVLDDCVRFNAICQRMGECVTRPEGAENLPYNVSWSTRSRDDDWWHVRRLLQMLADRYSMPAETYENFELSLVLLLAAIEGGSTEAIAWLVGLEIILHEIAREVRSSSFVSDQTSHDERKLQGSLLQALVTFVHAVALNNLVLRCHRQGGGRGEGRNAAQPTPFEKWYSALYNTNPRCALSECQRLLPHPSTVKAGKARDAFSVGTRDARTGNRLARYFISGRSRTRFGHIYDCIFSLLPRYETHPVLINAFFWFGGMYHTDSSCKACRGRSVQNF